MRRCIAGARIARRLGWPLIVDYRDPWSALRLAALAAQRACRSGSRGASKRRIVRRSAARVLNTPSDARRRSRKFFPRADHARNFVIPNGFDAAAGEAPAPPTTGPIDIVHAGEIFTGRSLVPVLRAAAATCARGIRSGRSA